jgi:flagellar biosynthesis GTPase FlhF
MKRTKKINKKNKIFNKRKTSKRRFNKKGGVQKKCDICGVAFHMTGTVGAPPKSQLFGAELFEDHIKTHPICKYCNSKHLDVNRLIEHIKTEHPDNYNTAKKIKFGILNESNLIDELRNKNQTVVGYSPDFDLFYDKIDKASIEKMNSKPITKNVPNKPLKSDVKAKQRENNNKKESEMAEQLESSRRAIAEEQRILREAAEKRKQEKLEAAEKEALMLKEQAQALKKEKEKEKKAAKRLAKDQEQETSAMEAEEIISKQFNDNIKQAESVDEVINIIENNKTKLSSAASEFVPSKKQEQQQLKLIDILTEKDFQYLPSSKWYLAIQRLYPALSGYTEIVRANKNYIDISFFIIFLMGVINFRLNAKKINLKLILKGGKASQMLMSTHGINNTDILTDDVDILLVQEGVYDYNFLLNFASDFAGFINYFFNYQLSILAPPNPILTNKNIVKISFVNNGLPKYIPLSDIDFKQIESEYLQGENIISSTSIWNVFEKQKNVYTYNLLFYHQSLEAFIAEKKYYLQIYDNIIQKKNETENCDCADIHDHECSQICDYRNKMLDKFHKYINPLEQIQQTINNK